MESSVSRALYPWSYSPRTAMHVPESWDWKTEGPTQTPLSTIEKIAIFVIFEYFLPILVGPGPVAVQRYEHTFWIDLDVSCPSLDASLTRKQSLACRPLSRASTRGSVPPLRCAHLAGPRRDEG